MKILWVSNSPIGPASSILGEEYKGSSGGWIQSEYENLDKTDCQMFFLCTSSAVPKGKIVHKTNELGEVYCIRSPKISYGIKNPQYMEMQTAEIVDKINPDIIQIWGTETCLSNSVSRLHTTAPKIIFMQGILGIHKKYLGGYFGNLKEDKKYFSGISIYARFKTIMKRMLLIRQANIEAETIKNCGKVIIDNNFSRAYCKSLSPNIKCFEHLLLPNRLFQKYHWTEDGCKKHSIFTIYGGSAEKGLQQLLKAAAILKIKYPDIEVLIPGIYNLDTYKKLVPSKNNTFEVVLSNMLKHLDLSDNVRFLGLLSAEGMAENINHANAFVNPSCMEVHALSLREALTVGIPCVSSLCGSVEEYVQHGINGFIYRYEEYEVLAFYLDKIFSEKETAAALSEKAVHAMSDLNRGEKASLNDIYKMIL